MIKKLLEAASMFFCSERQLFCAEAKTKETGITRVIKSRAQEASIHQNTEATWDNGSI